MTSRRLTKPGVLTQRVTAADKLSGAERWTEEQRRSTFHVAPTDETTIDVDIRSLGSGV